MEKHIKYSPYIKDGRWVVDTRRKIRDIKELSPIILNKKQGFGKNLKDAKTALLYDQETLKIKEKKYLTFIDKFT